MLLHKLKLSNIRSYQDQCIEFPQGSMLLSGDIGSGKSSLLLAIEFALFGTSRPDLPAEYLLRKGSAHGSVELTFSLGGKEIIIARNLKKERDGIKQNSGYIIKNNMKKELMAVELKAEIINLLGYPEEVLTKNKNYIFRYTVYTPQEAMKEILQEDPEIRMDVLRRIFNIDKYKHIRENAQLYLKQLRAWKDILQTKIQPLEQEQQKVELLQQETKCITQQLSEISPQLELQHAQMQTVQEELIILEQKQKSHLEQQRQLKTIVALSAQKNEQLATALQQQDQLRQQLSGLSLPPGTAGDTELQINALHQQRNEYLTRKTILQERTTQLQSKLKEIDLSVRALTAKIAVAPEKEQMKSQLAAEVSQQAELEQKKQQLDSLLADVTAVIIKTKTLLQQAREAEINIISLDHCPTCQQDVSIEHKQKIKQQEIGKIKRAEIVLADAYPRQADVMQQHQLVLAKINQLLLKNNLLAKITLELQQLEEQKTEITEKQHQSRQLTTEHGRLSEQLQLLEQEEVQAEREKKLTQLQTIREAFSKQQYLTQQISNVTAMIIQIRDTLSTLSHQQEVLQQQVITNPDVSGLIDMKKKILCELALGEKTLSIRQAEFLTQQKILDRRVVELQQSITLLVTEKNKLIRYQELHHWLESYFVELTYTIEKQVMGTIHQLFNSFFQEWFSILIDEENVSSKIDATFTPIIEQNGQEVSFFNLSGGEKTSAALAYRLALNRVINDIISEIKTKNLLILDEPTDGFSLEQLDKVREVLDRLHLQQTIIVSHEAKIETFVENIIRIQKQGHVSSIIQ